MSNKHDGTTFERKFADILYRRGFWALNIPDGKNGQPFDIVAVRNNRAYAFDCKSCAGQRFLFSRIEENQRNAFYAWKTAGNDPAMLALYIPAAIYLLRYSDIRKLEKRNVHSLSVLGVKEHGIELGQWLKGLENETDDKQ